MLPNVGEPLDEMNLELPSSFESSALYSCPDAFVKFPSLSLFVPLPC